MSAKNDAVLRPAITGTADGLAVHIDTLREYGEPITLRTGLDVLPIAQDFTFYRTEVKDGEETEVETTETLVYTPEGIASVLVHGVAPKTVEYVYWTTPGISIPYVFEGGAVKASTKMWGAIDASLKRPFFDLSLGNDPESKKAMGKIGGAHDTVTTTLWTTGLSRYFLTTDDPLPGESKADSIPYAKLIEEVRINVANMRKLGIDVTPEQEQAAIDARLAARKAEIEAKNAKGNGPAVNPETLSMAS